MWASCPKKAPGQWGFSHQTFQEYFAAREIARRPRQMPPEAGSRRAPDPRWTEVIRLAIAYLGSETGAPRTRPHWSNETILQRPDPYERYLHRNLLLAGPGAGRRSGVPMPPLPPIARRLFDLFLKTEVATLQESAGTVLLEMLGTRLRTAILQWVIPAIRVLSDINRFAVLILASEIWKELLQMLTAPVGICGWQRRRWGGR